MQHTTTKSVPNTSIEKILSSYTEIILSIMLALCLMLSGTYYVQNYASIIGNLVNQTAFFLLYSDGSEYKRKKWSGSQDYIIGWCLIPNI